MRCSSESICRSLVRRLAGAGSSPCFTSGAYTGTTAASSRSRTVPAPSFVDGASTSAGDARRLWMLLGGNDHDEEERIGERFREAAERIAGIALIGLGPFLAANAS